MSAPQARRPFDWEAAGRELGERLGEYNAIVVTGLDPVATGRVAVGLARVQAEHRRVAVGDLFAESPPIQALVDGDDPHGIVDSFLYGVSLTKIAHKVPDAGQLYVMPSGSEPPSYEEILPNPRWHRLAAGFREVGALFVLAAPTSAAHIDKLVAATDGVVIVGDTAAPQIPAASVIGSVREPRERRPSPIVIPPSSSRVSGRRTAAIAGIGLTLVTAAIAAWLAYRPLAGCAPNCRHEPDCRTLAAGGKPCTPPGRTPTVAMSPDSARSDSSSDTAKAVVAPPAFPQVVDPEDSAAVSAFAVQLMAANTQAGAILKLQKDGKNLPAATFSPAIIQGVRWYKVVSGAFASYAGADSLLTRLRQRKLLLGNESVVRLPFAFRIDSGVRAAAVPEMVATYADHGQPVYALRQADGTAWLLVGAYESPEQAALYRELLPSGSQPVLVYRKGRSF
ncbi:MAG: SPOR domain-containing protein [Gemmatimonadaceae bacterium]